MRLWLINFLIGLSSLASTAVGQTFEGFTEPVRCIDVSAADSGRIAEVHVKRGDHVEQGQMLVGLDATVLQASRRAAQAKANSEARLNASQIESQLRQDRYDQLLALHRDGAGSAEEVKRAKADAEVARLNIEAAREELEQSRLEFAEIEARIEQRRVRSPINGAVTEVRKDVGEYVSTHDPHLVTIVDLTELRATFYLPTALAMTMKSGQVVALEFPGLRQRTQGQIEYVAKVTDADSGRVRVDVLVDNQKGSWRSGVRCAIHFHNGFPSDASDDTPSNKDAT